MRRVFFRIERAFFLLLLLCSVPGILAPVWSEPLPNVLRLTHKLQRALVDLPGYTVFDYVTFRITDDRVVLVGSVLHPEVKQAAEQAIRSMPGVTAVENDIEVLPQSEQDNALRAKVYDRIYRNPQFASYAVQVIPPVHIVVRNGHVTLEGLVNNLSDRFIAQSAASEAVEPSVVEDHLLATTGDTGELASLSMSLP